MNKIIKVDSTVKHKNSKIIRALYLHRALHKAKLKPADDSMSLAFTEIRAWKMFSLMLNICEAISLIVAAFTNWVYIRRAFLSRGFFSSVLLSSFRVRLKISYFAFSNIATDFRRVELHDIRLIYSKAHMMPITHMLLRVCKTLERVYVEFAEISAGLPKIMMSVWVSSIRRIPTRIQLPLSHKYPEIIHMHETQSPIWASDIHYFPQ